MTNRFLISAAHSPEDRLTSSWAYVLGEVPGLGQAFVDYIARRAQLPATKLRRYTDHPPGEKGNHPDFLLECEDYDLFCEHKIDSGLGPRQLERYLTLCTDKRRKLVLIAARRLDIPSAVCSSPAYVCPRDGSTVLHFLWQDVHSILHQFRHGVAREFAEYLSLTGLEQFSWGKLGDPFTDQNAAAELRKLYGVLSPSFKGHGVVLRSRSNSLIFEIRKPFRPIHLINIAPMVTVLGQDPDSPISSRVMALLVWVERPPDQRDKPILPNTWREGRKSASRAYLQESSQQVFLSSTDFYYKGPPPIYQERVYYTSLDNILLPSTQASRNALRTFVLAATDHLRTEVASSALDA